MTSLLLHAAASAAQADGVAATANNMQPPQRLDGSGKGSKSGSVAGNGSSSKGPPLRRGKWTAEEEAYANRLIQEFKAGLLPLTDGTTLRTFLSKLLNCDPMRISKKFVGSNCIGKQVFRRRTADLNRLTPEQIQKSRVELSELERRFLERVAQTNRVKSNSIGGVCGGGSPTPVLGQGGSTINNTQGGSSSEIPGFPLGTDILGGNGNANVAAAAAFVAEQQRHAAFFGMGGDLNGMEQQTPPWLMPPTGYKHGQGAAYAASHLSSNPSAAAAGRAMLGALGGAPGGNTVTNSNVGNNDPTNNINNNAAFHQSTSGLSVGSGNGSSADLLAQLQRRASQQSFLRDALGGSSGGFSSTALAQLAQNASAARLAGLGSNPSSMANLFSNGNAGDAMAVRGLSAASLTNALNRKSSFDALMSLDFQSLQSIDNLANLIQTGGAQGSVPSSGLKNADFSLGVGQTSNSNLAAAQRLVSAGRMDSLLNGRGLGQHNSSHTNVGAHADSAPSMISSSANFNNLLQSMQEKGSAASLLSSLHPGAPGAASHHAMGQHQSSHNNMTTPSAVNLAHLLRQDSSTGLSALRVQDGLSQRNTSVDDFLSLMAAGDIPHQDPSLLNIPLMQQQLNQAHTNPEAAAAAARLLAAHQQRQLMQSNALSTRSLQNLQHAMSNGGGSKRKLEDLDPSFPHQQGALKRLG